MKASDFTPSGNLPTIYDVWKLLVEVSDSLAEVKRQQKDHVTAFLKNDLDEPDFDGHRRSHTKLIVADKLITEYKTDATKKVIAVIVIFAMGLLASGMITKLGILLK